MSGEWTGGAANRTWQRPGNRNRNIGGDRERAAALWLEMRDKSFWCDNCGSMHALIEHRQCRADFPFRTAVRGAT